MPVLAARRIDRTQRPVGDSLFLIFFVLPAPGGTRLGLIGSLWDLPLSLASRCSSAWSIGKALSLSWLCFLSWVCPQRWAWLAYNELSAGVCEISRTSLAAPEYESAAARRRFLGSEDGRQASLGAVLVQFWCSLFPLLLLSRGFRHKLWRATNARPHFPSGSKWQQK